MLFRFLDCELDTDRCELSRAGEPIALRAKLYHLLLYLIEQRHRRVSKDEVLEQVWPDRVVSDATLSSCIKALRQAVGDDGQRQHVIQTLRGMGYRFVADVREVTASVSPDVAPLEDRSDPDLVPDSAPDDAPPSPPLPLGRSGREYKQVSVLCGGLTEGRTLMQELDPETMDRLMGDFFSLVEQAIERYEGVVTQRHGDGFVALFGAPRAHEDHVRRSVLAALALRELLAAHESFTAQASRTIGLAIHTGPVVVGGLATAPEQLYTALGETTDIAAKLQRRAAPGALLMSATAHRLVSTEIRAARQGMLGDEEGVTFYAVEGVDRRLGGVPRRKAVASFVGRERELAMLRRSAEELASGRGQVVGIVGEPGIGKSRLLEEFRRELEASDDGALFLEGRCLSYGGTSPYLPLLDMLRQCCDVVVEDAGDVVAAKVARTLDRLGVPAVDAGLLLRLLDVETPPTPLDDMEPQQRRERTFAGLRELIRQRVRQSLCVLAVEDAHWIDATSDDWLAELVAQLAGMPLLLLITYRPGYHPVWLEHSGATQLALMPLPQGDSERLVRSLPPGGSASARQIERVVATAQGNPFFLEELSWTLQRTDEEAAPPPLPDTVQAVVAARIDRLDSPDKELLQTGAVIGARVPSALLRDLLPFSDEELAQSLQRLQTAEFLYEVQGYPTTLYAFKHALTREVAYRSLLHGARRRLHREIAERLCRESTERGISPELIAHHYTEAGLTEPAIEHWQWAARHAAARSASAEAIGHLERALQLLRGLSDGDAVGRAERELALQLELGVLLQVVRGAGSEEVERVYAEAVRLSERAGDATQRFAALWGKWRLHNTRGDDVVALRIAEDLLELSEREHRPRLLLEARHALWMTTGWLGRLETAREHIAAGIALSESSSASPLPLMSAGGHDPIVCAFGMAAVVDWVLGHPVRAEGYVDRTLELAGKLDHPPTLAQGLVAVVDHYQLRQEVRPLQTWAERLIDCATEHGFATARAGGLFSSGWCLARQGRCDEGIERMTEALRDLKRIGYLRPTPYLQALLAERCVAAGRLEEGFGHLEEVWSGCETVGGNFWLSAEIYRLIGETLLNRGHAQRVRAERCFDRAMTIARRQGARAFELRAAMSVCHHGRDRSGGRARREALASIYGTFDEGLDTPDLRRAKTLLDELADAGVQEV